MTLTVDPAQCAMARRDLVNVLYSWPAWNQLKDYLLDRGFSPEFLHEAISPLDHAEAYMQVDSTSAAAYIESVSNDVLAEITGYFQAPIDLYIDTWRSLTTVRDEGDWEMVVPQNGLISIVSLETPTNTSLE